MARSALFPVADPNQFVAPLVDIGQEANVFFLFPFGSRFKLLIRHGQPFAIAPEGFASPPLGVRLEFRIRCSVQYELECGNFFPCVIQFSTVSF